MSGSLTRTRVLRSGAVVLAVALLSAAAYLFFRARSGAPAPAGEDVAPPPHGDGLSTYRAPGGFSLRYPAGMIADATTGPLFAPPGAAEHVLIMDPAREPSIDIPAKGNVPAGRESDGIAVSVYGPDRRAAAQSAIDAAIAKARKNPEKMRLKLITVAGTQIAFYELSGPYGPYWAGYMSRGGMLYLFTTRSYDMETILATLIPNSEPRTP